MPTFSTVATDVAWPLAVALAWIVGELGHRWTKLPRISLYGLTGFLLGHSQTGFLPEANTGPFLLLANIGFGLILFEFGYRINLRWLFASPWVGASSILEILLTFASVYAAAALLGTPGITALLLASLAISTSPAAVLRVVNEQRSSGAVTERLLHLSAFNCIAAVLLFNVTVGIWTLQSNAGLWQDVAAGFAMLIFSAAIGGICGVIVPAILRRLGNLDRDATVALAISVVAVVAVTHALKYSPTIATLCFGFTARQRRVALSRTQRNYGTLGDILTVLLFLFVATTLEYSRVIAGLGLGMVLVGVRLAAKVAGVTAFSQVSGISWKKGMLTGIGLTPISVFVILMLEQTRYFGIDLLDQLAPLAAATLLLEVLGPILTQLALKWASEAAET